MNGDCPADVSGIFRNIPTSVGDLRTARQQAMGEPTLIVDTTARIVSMDSDIQKLLYGLLGPAIIGLPGNILAIAVASTRQNRKLSPSVYIIAMGVADSVFLLEIIWLVAYQRFFDEGMMLDSITLLTRYMNNNKPICL
jgi:hypothetical protein